MADSIYTDVANVISAGGYDLDDLSHRIDVLYASGELSDAEREELRRLAEDGADPDAQLPDITERVSAIEMRVAAIEEKLGETQGGGDDPGTGGTTDPEQPAYDPEWPPYVQPTSKDTQYRKGDKITWTDGKHYVCVKNNVVSGPDNAPKSWELAEDQPEDCLDADTGQEQPAGGSDDGADDAAGEA